MLMLTLPAVFSVNGIFNWLPAGFGNASTRVIASTGVTPPDEGPTFEQSAHLMLHETKGYCRTEAPDAAEEDQAHCGT